MAKNPKNCETFSQLDTQVSNVSGLNFLGLGPGRASIFSHGRAGLGLMIFQNRVSFRAHGLFHITLNFLDLMYSKKYDDFFEIL